MDQVYFFNQADGATQIFHLNRGMDLNQYMGEWQNLNDTIVLAVKTRQGNLIEESRWVKDINGLRSVESSLFPELTLSGLSPVDASAEDRTGFLNKLFLISEVEDHPLEISPEDRPVFIYFEQGNQEFIIARAFLGCQLSSSTISPRPDENRFRVYPFPAIRESDCPQYQTEVKVRDAYRRADNFKWLENQLLILSEDQTLLKLDLVGKMSQE